VKLYQLSGKKMLRVFKHSFPAAVANADVAGETVFNQATATAAAARDDDDEDEEEVDAIAAVECVGFCNAPEFRWLASGGMDKTLKIWDANLGSCRSVCSHEGSVVALKWHKTLPLVATVALDHAARVWDARSGRVLCVLTGHTQMVTNFDWASFPSPVTAPVVVPRVVGEFASETEYAAAATTTEQIDATVTTAFGEPLPMAAYTDALVSISDDKTARVFLLDINSLLR
jgi:WD40 repeat protein